MNVYPLKILIGRFELTGYGIMMMVAFLMAGWAMQLELRRRRLNEDYAADIVVAAVVGGLLGAKLWYMALHGGPLLSRGGLVWYGGFLGGVVAVLANGWRKRVPMSFTCELCAPALALGYGLGRVGCFMVNDDYGVPSSLPWAVRFPKGLPPTTVADLSNSGVSFPPGTDPTQVVAVHPTQLYETAVMLAVFAWLWHRRDHHHGTGWLFGCYLILAGLERLLVEFIRVKDDRFFGSLSLAQAVAVGLVLAGLVVILRTRGRAPQGEPAALVPKTG
jgi:phosphatidylglycerol:prolipoprotein diacylglycerol transferase